MSDDFPIYDFDPRNLPQEFLAAVGLVAESSAHTEGIVQTAIAGCMSLPPDYATAVTAHLAAPMRDNILRSIAEIRIESLDALDELDKILDEITSAFKLRNDYMHFPLIIDKNTNDVFLQKITARGSIDAQLLPKSVDDIKRDAITIYTSGIKLYAFLKMHDLLPPLPDSLPARAHKTKSARKKRRDAFLRRNPSKK